MQNWDRGEWKHAAPGVIRLEIGVRGGKGQLVDLARLTVADANGFAAPRVAVRTKEEPAALSGVPSIWWKLGSHSRGFPRLSVPKFFVSVAGVPVAGVAGRVRGEFVDKEVRRSPGFVCKRTV